MIVIDSSALLEVLLRREDAEKVSRRIFRAGETLLAPHLIDLEIAQVLRRYTLAGVMEEDRAREALQDYSDVALTRYPHQFLLPRIWELRRNLTAYDAVYLALAEALEAPLVTRDGAFAAVRIRGVKVEVL